ncbi:MAG: LacI family transcriptional regulator, partial [Mesorhizobium sp.]
MRSTLTDIAREAGVSAATVDRVLNNRAGVRARTREVVLETAQRLGYIAENSNGPIPRNAPCGDVIRLDFALPAGTNSFIKMLHRHIEAQAQSRPDLDVRVATIEGFNP